MGSNDQLPYTPEGKLDFLALTEKQCWKLSIQAGMDEFKSLQREGMTEGDDLYLLLGEIRRVGDRHHFIPGGDEGVSDYASYVHNVDPQTGKLSTVVEFGLDSELAFCDHTNHPFFQVGGKQKPRTWIGGVHARGAYQRFDGTWLHATFGAAASGDAGPVDKSAANAAAQKRLFLWYMQVRAQDKLDEAAAKAASGN